MELVKVDFKSNNIKVIEETQSIVVQDICDHIGLKFRTQYEKIRVDESYESKLIKVQTKGGLQEVFTIPLSKLNGWLFSINPNKVKPEVKQKLIEYKKECFNVLNDYFNKGIAVNQNNPSNKNIKCVIGGYKSQLSQTNKSISELQKTIQALQNENKELKIHPRAYNAMLEVSFQMASFKQDIKSISKELNTKYYVVNHYLDIFKQYFPKTEEYFKSLEDKNVSSNLF